MNAEKKKNEGKINDQINEKIKAVKEDKKENGQDENAGKDSEVDQLKEKIEELTNLLRNVQADFENYRKRVEREKVDNVYYHKKEIITSLLPVLDMFELALKHKEKKEEFIKGMEMIYSQLFATLENEGLSPIKENKNFDPHLHEAIIAEESDEEDGRILDEMQKGYKLNDKVIRYARVKVSKKDTGKKNGENKSKEDAEKGKE